MKHTERWLQLLIAAMAILGTCMLGLDGQMPAMLPLVCAAAVGGLILTDWLGWFHMHRYVVNLAAIAALTLTLNDFLQRSSSRQLLSIAYLLVCWEVVMLFQKKTLRVYWCLSVLSLLQVVVASVIHSEVRLSFLLAAYLIAGLAAMMLIYVHGELIRCAAARRRWRSAAGRAARMAACSEQSSERVAERLSGATFTRHLLALAAAAVVFAAVFFYGTPRRDLRGWAPGSPRVQTQTGFAAEVTLDQLGEILLSDELVMRVAFTDDRTGDPYELLSEPYFLGGTLDQYGNGRWFSSRTGLPNKLVAARPTSQDRVRVQALMEPTSHPNLFSVRPFFALPFTPANLRELPRNQTLERSETTRSELRAPFRYALLTTAFRRGRQRPTRPHEIVEGRLQRAGPLPDEDRATLLEIERWRFPQLIALAEQILAPLPPDASESEKAGLLQSHFATSGAFTYSLQMPSRPPRGRDPIEHFVAEVRAGHCEYFASGLAIMLRSQGIPARLVVGYRGGDHNPVGNYYLVRQKHAHAWVEAYLEPETPGAAGVWLTLDPTPGAEAPAASRARIDNFLDYANLLWKDYLLGVTSESEQHPIQAAFDEDSVLGRFTRRSKSLAAIQRAWRRTYAAVDRWLGGQWFSWRAGLLAMGAFGAAIFALRAGQRLAALLAAWIRSGKRALNPPINVWFYQRLEKMLRRCGLVCPRDLTQEEFAQRAARRLRDAGLAEVDAVAEVPARVTAAFYRVRFGGGALDSGESREIEQSLENLEQVLAAHRRILTKRFKAGQS